jgi:phenylalanine-4-hydroxylase
MGQAISPLLELPADHPGASDPEYRARRAAIAAVAERHRPGDPIPTVDYTPDEDAVWREVSGALRDRHAHLACRAYRDGADALDLPVDTAPQLAAVDARLRTLTGFRLVPTPGLVPTRTFYGALADRRFHATQYVRHPSVPFYTPEPDVIHEVIGHANALAAPAFAALYRSAGEAARRCETDAALDTFSRIFWFALEFGVVREGGQLRAAGAGLLSSFGELEVFRSAAQRPWDAAGMATLAYDITRYQPVLFVADSFARFHDDLMALFHAFDDDTAARLRRS